MASRYVDRLSDRTILDLIRSGKYRVSSDTGEVFGRFKDKPLTPYSKPCGHRFIRIYHAGKSKKITAVARVIWMACTGKTIPEGFEIHHLNNDNTDDSWKNLVCVHKEDHKKLHAHDKSEPVPF
jgi:hypothetical protein